MRFQNTPKKVSARVRPGRENASDPIFTTEDTETTENGRGYNAVLTTENTGARERGERPSPPSPVFFSVNSVSSVADAVLLCARRTADGMSHRDHRGHRARRTPVPAEPRLLLRVLRALRGEYSLRPLTSRARSAILLLKTRGREGGTVPNCEAIRFRAPRNELLGPAEEGEAQRLAAVPESPRFNIHVR